MLMHKVTHFSCNLSFEVATTNPNPEIWLTVINNSHWFSVGVTNLGTLLCLPLKSAVFQGPLIII